MSGRRTRFDFATARAVVAVSLPLMLGMVGNLVMMTVDRICLARYSAATLEASDPTPCVRSISASPPTLLAAGAQMVRVSLADPLSWGTGAGEVWTLPEADEPRSGWVLSGSVGEFRPEVPLVSRRCGAEKDRRLR